MGQPVILRVKRGDVADIAITAGDPERVEQVAEMLDKAKLVNRNRGLLVYTGEYKGRKITVATHGIGAPSASIVFEELAMVGAKTIVRLGTCGAMVKELNIGDIVIPTGAASVNGSIRMYIPDGSLPAVPDVKLTYMLMSRCEEEGLKYLNGPVVSVDAFYAENPEFVKKWTERGAVAVEMECSILFTLGLLRGFRTAALLVVSDSLVKEEQKEMVTAKEIKEYVSKAARIMLDVISREV